MLNLTMITKWQNQFTMMFNIGRPDYCALWVKWQTKSISPASTIPKGSLLQGAPEKSNPLG